MMAAKKPVKKVAKKAAPKKAARKKVVAKKAAPKPVARKAAPAPKAAPPAKRKVIRSRIGKSPVAKGGIFPWITNKPGSKRSAPPSPPAPPLPLVLAAHLPLARPCCAAYGRPLTLSSVDFTSDASDAWIGWGFMPKSVKASLYPKGYKGMLNK